MSPGTFGHTKLALRSALAEHGVHPHGCGDLKGLPCTCGIAAALTPTPKPTAEHQGHPDSGAAMTPPRFDGPTLDAVLAKVDWAIETAETKCDRAFGLRDESRDFATRAQALRSLRRSLVAMRKRGSK